MSRKFEQTSKFYCSWDLSWRGGVVRGQKWPNAPLTPPFSTPGAVNAALLFDRALDIAQHVHFLHKFEKKKFLKILF